jgi:ribonuclease D
MMNLPATPSDLLTTPARLAELCDHLRSAGTFAYDTEFIGETTYHPILCLIQVATTERVEMIDPQVLDRQALLPFWQLLADPSLEKICHAGDQDVEIVWLESGLAPQNMFDTQIAAGMLGITYPTALWRAVEHFTGVTLAKSHTFSAWNRRPLTRAQFNYAIDDVRYLPTIHQAMRQQLETLSRMPWMRAACDEMCSTSCQPVNARQLYTRIRGAAILKPRNLAVLREVTALRQQHAYELNVPARTFLKDEVLFEIAQRAPATLAELARIRDLPPEEVQANGTEILAAVKTGLACPDADLPSIFIPPEDSAEIKRLAETLWVATQAICLGQQVNPGLVTSQSEITALARLIHHKHPFDRHPLMHGWHAECLGTKLAAFIAGTLQIHLTLQNETLHARFASPQPFSV